MDIVSKDTLKTLDTRTTTFDDDGDIINADYSLTMASDGLPIFQQGIADFLAKPYLMSAFDWSDANLQNSTLYTLPIGQTIKSGTTLPNPYKVDIWYDKLKGYNLFRGTFVIKVIINANPFQAGALLGHVLPLAAAHAEAGDVAYTAAHNANLTTKSQQPKFVLTTTDSGAEIEIPYIAPTNWFLPSDGPVGNSSKTFDWGTFYLDVFSVLRTGAGQPNNISVSIYGFWKDVELGAPMVPQMLGKIPTKNKKYKKSIVVKKMSQASKEASTSDAGKPVTQFLMSAGKVASSLSSIPILENAMRPTAWALQAAAGISSYFGWSKPLNGNVPSVVSNQYNRYFATSDGSEMATPLGLRSDNSLVCRDDLSPYDGDEMSFSFLKKQSAYIRTIPWTTAQVDGTSLLSFYVTPTEMRSLGSVTKGANVFNYSTGPPVFYLSRFFAMWRGSVVVRIKIIKTQMHTGRLQVTWTPSYNFNGVVDRTNSTYALREMIDIRNSDELELVLPYMIDSHYLDKDEPSGRLDIQIINELRAPNTVADNVDLLVFMSGGDDFEYAGPLRSVTPGINLQAFSPQVYAGDGGGLISTCVVGDIPCPSADIVHADMCNGELFTSVKQLIARHSQLSINSTGLTLNEGCEMDPWVISMVYGTNTGLAGPTIGGDNISVFSHMYAMFRGGVNITVNLFTPTANGGQYFSIRDIPPGAAAIANRDAPRTQFGGNYGVATAINTTGLGPTAIFGRENSYNTVSVPYYSATHASLTYAITNASNTSVGRSHPKTGVSLFIEGATAARYFRNARDDYQLCYFVGCPPLFDSITA